jgi:microcystin-dependent protein
MKITILSYLIVVGNGAFAGTGWMRCQGSLIIPSVQNSHFYHLGKQFRVDYFAF